jgi:hypothetical protein
MAYMIVGGQDTSLQELALDVSEYVLSDLSALLSVVDALANNTQVTDLTLHLGDDEDDVEERVDVLHTLHQNTTLQKLSLGVHDMQDNGSYLVPGHAWESLLRSDVPLLSLGLSYISFDGDAVEYLLNGLISQDNAIDLELDRCFFGNGAIDTLVRLVPGIQKCLVSSLTVKGPRCDPRNPQWNKLVAALYPLSGVSPFLHLTIKLSKELTCGLLDQLRIKSPKQMTSLKLRCGGVEDIFALFMFVKSAVHLKKLTVDLSNWGEDCPEYFGDFLRENGSLVDVGEGLTRAYFLRNENLRLLLEQRPMPLTDLPLVPSLFHVAKAAKKLSPTTILMGLLGYNPREIQHHQREQRPSASD